MNDVDNTLCAINILVKIETMPLGWWDDYNLLCHYATFII